jgi:hypothetical protein
MRSNALSASTDFGRPSVAWGDGDEREPLCWRPPMSDPTQFVTLAVAMTELGVVDQGEFVRTAQRHGCLLKRGGITRVNLPELKRLIDEDFVKAQVQITNRRESPNTAGKQIGLLRARLVQYPSRIAKKQAKITVAEKAITAAKDRYTRNNAEVKLADARGELDNLKAGQQRDERLLKELLDGGEPESNTQ